MSAAGSGEGGTFAAALDIDAELRELQSFVLVETGHMPTVTAVGALRASVAKALGHSDPWCVSHCRPGVRHSACGCRCGQHRRPIASPACPCGCPAEMHIGEIGCPCALPGEPPCVPTIPPSIHSVPLTPEARGRRQQHLADLSKPPAGSEVRDV